MMPLMVHFFALRVRVMKMADTYFQSCQSFQTLISLPDDDDAAYKDSEKYSSTYCTSDRC
jgi:hypothetical protein